MGRFGQSVDRVERIIIAFLMGAMVLTSFAQVVARYVFNTGWLGALEFTRILFAWLILFGMSYGVKIGSHLGVDTFVRAFPKPIFRAFAIFGALCGVLYAAIFFAADWLQLFGLPTSGGAYSYWLRTFNTGIGLHELRYPEWAQHAFGMQARVHRWVVYFILPLGLALLAYRCAQAAIQIWRGEREMITISHESGELMDEETFAGTHEPSAASGRDAAAAKRGK
ncbi:MAG: TRAP transporter small permease [Pseudomonadota bacterium]|jgi:C4-dicarboxylate transporter DctQ subunit|uniref:TRAP transporter small permease n=1 Tax=Roseixanthobacter finlandensis TaxID=3119922 RepID=UPI000BDA876A|nr:MAG: C4-dicarboxylate ABC transporter [Rhizobiales bacterium 39-66-18]HQS46909.1 TRAP transporter small permease [Xanthobacteraceae bacterium]